MTRAAVAATATAAAFTLPSLPDELIVAVLVNLDDARAIARCKLVSRQWYRAARGNFSLWRGVKWTIDDGNGDDDGKARGPSLLSKRIDALLLRCGGDSEQRVLDLTVRVRIRSLYASVVHDVDDNIRLMDVLPSLGVRRLHIECLESRRLFKPLSPQPIERLRQRTAALPIIVQTMMSRCAHLESLTFVAPDWFAFTKLPLVLPPFQLRSLHLECGGMNALFTDDNLFATLANAVSVTLRPTNDATTMPLDVVWRLLTSTADTIQHADVTVDRLFVGDASDPNRGGDKDEDPQTVIFLPRLRSLAITETSRYYGPRSQRRINTTPDRRLACPALRHLKLSGVSLLPLLTDLLYATPCPLQSLALESPPASCDGVDYTAGIAALLNDTVIATLTRLTLRGGVVRQLLRDLTRYPRMRFDDLTLITDRVVALNDVKAFIRSRLAYRLPCAPLRRLHILSGLNFSSDDAAWVRTHVPHVNLGVGPMAWSG